jgi:hypothetical protein
MDLLDDRDAFYLEHRRCGEFEAEISELEPLWIVMASNCGAQLARRVDEEFLDR